MLKATRISLRWYLTINIFLLAAIPSLTVIWLSYHEIHNIIKQNSTAAVSTVTSQPLYLSNSPKELVERSLVNINNKADDVVQAHPSSAEAFTSLEQLRIKALLLAVIALSFTLAIALLIARRIASPIERMTCRILEQNTGLASNPLHNEPSRNYQEITDLSAAFTDMQSRFYQANRDNEALLTTLNLHAIISTADSDGIITSVNDAFCSISGYSREELIGKNHRIVNSGVQSHAFWVAMWADISTGKSWRHIVCNRAKNGSHYWVDTVIAPFFDGLGRVEKYISIRMDITASKHNESALIQAYEDAKIASVSKSQFLANMSHEIRTPMNAILGMLTLLRKTPMTPQQADYATKSDGAARSLLAIINEILDFSKIEAGKMTLDPHLFNMEQLLRDLSVLLSVSLAAKQVEILYDIDPELPLQLIGDNMRLQQVLLNLGSNAIKFTPQGNIVLSIKIRDRSADTVTLEFSVRDTGIGISAEHQTQIFSGFTQAEANTTRRFGGTGLGLAISKHFVQLMDGELALESTLGQGSRFYFSITLPWIAATKVHDNTPNQAYRVLLVDDNSVARCLLSKMCKSLGWETDIASGGEDALTILQANSRQGIFYDAIFMDWQMPNLDGFQTSQKIRRLTGIGNVSVIVMVTAYGREALAQCNDTNRAVIDDFLMKPVTAAMLLETLTRQINKSTLVSPSSLLTGTAIGNNTSAEPLARLANLRILLVEDNFINQQIAQELLEGEGAIVHIVDNGQEGVNVLNVNTAFDVVLMDLQMPVMDGLTATRYIRDNLNLQTLPIIAMTANAMTHDREACFAAGMNDHVGKPFELTNLVAVIRKHIATTTLATNETQTQESLSSVAAVSAEIGLDLSAALLRMGGKHDMYKRILDRFIKDLITMPDKLQDLAQRGNTEELKRALHTLKGLAATVGATHLSAEIALYEKQLVPASSITNNTLIAERASAVIEQSIVGLQRLHTALQTEYSVL